jgi:hypothetical protein
MHIGDRGAVIGLELELERKQQQKCCEPAVAAICHYRPSLHSIRRVEQENE